MIMMMMMMMMSYALYHVINRTFTVINGIDGRYVDSEKWRLNFARVYSRSVAIVGLQGSPGYWPPEVLEHRPFNPRTADVWALGVTLHVLLTSRLPFSGDSDVNVDENRALAMMRRGLDLSPSGPSRSVRLSAPVIELLRGLLHYVTEVSRRLSSYIQYTPLTRRNCRVQSRRQCVYTEFATRDSLDESELEMG